MGVKKNLVGKKFWVKKNLGQTFVRAKKIGPVIFWGQQNLGRKFVSVKKNFDKKKIGSEFLGGKKNLGLKNLWDLWVKKCGSEILLGQK